MAELRDELILDIDKALAQVTELENALNRALSDLVLNINAGSAAAATDEISDNLYSAARAGDSVDDALDDVRRTADRAADEVGRIDDEAKKADSSFKGMASSLKGIAVGVGVGVGLREIVGFLGDAMQAASDSAEAANAVRVVFGDASDAIISFAEDTSDAVFLAASDVESLATVTGNLLQGFGLSASTAADLTIELTNRAADMASVFNTDVDEALNAVNAAIRGEAEQIRKYTGSFSIDEVKAFGRELFGVNGELTSQQQALAAVELIMQKTAATQGDAANTADSYANQQRHLNELWENAKGTIGSALIPALTEVTPLLVDLIGVAEDLTPALSAVVGVLTAGIEELKDYVDPLLSLVSGIADFATGADAATVAGISLGDVFKFGTDRAKDFVAYGILAPVTLGNKLINFFTDAGDEADQYSRDTANALGEASLAYFYLGDAAAAAGVTVPDATDAMTQSVLDLADALPAATGNIADLAEPTDTVVGSFNELKDRLDELPDAVKAVGDAAGIYGDDLADFGDAFNDAAQAANDFRLATLELSNPVFAAARAQERLTDAQSTLAELQKDGEASAQDIANAQLDLAEAVLEADAAARGLGNVSLVGGPFQRSVGILAEALGVTSEEILTILDDANVLDQTDIGPQVTFEVDDTELQSSLNGIPEEVSIQLKYIATGVNVAKQALNTALGAASTIINNTLNVNNPTDSDIQGNAQQGANILSGISGATQGFTDR